MCHVYIDDKADWEKAMRIADNAKTQRYGTCNTLETLLVHKDIAGAILPPLSRIYIDKGVELRGDEAARALVSEMKAASEEDWYAEYLAPILAVRVVDGLDEAIDHITQYGSQHTDAIVTEDWSGIEGRSDSLERKSYCPEVGVVPPLRRTVRRAGREDRRGRRLPPVVRG